MAHNRAITHVAKEARRPRSVELDEALPDPATTPDQAAERDEARGRLERAVAQLPLGQRLVVTLALEGFSPEEIANVLGHRRFGGFRPLASRQGGAASSY